MCPDHGLDVAHPPNVGQARLRPVEESPLVEQADAVGPAFDFLAAPEPLAEKGANLGEGQLKLTPPDMER
jgi:hypothetical protein